MSLFFAAVDLKGSAPTHWYGVCFVYVRLASERALCQRCQHHRPQIIDGASENLHVKVVAPAGPTIRLRMRYLMGARVLADALSVSGGMIRSDQIPAVN